jgi:hypothetical protein
MVGLPPINDTSTKNKNVAIITDSLNRSKKRVLRKHWRKFARRTDLNLDSNSKIPTSSYLKIVYPPALKEKLTEKNGFVWDLVEDQYYATAIQKAWIVTDIDFVQISSDAWAEYITLDAAVEFAMRLNDVDGNYAEIYRLRKLAKMAAINEARVNLDAGFGLTVAEYGFYD